MTGSGVCFHQTLIAAAPGDAVTSSALEIRRLLRNFGPSEIFARHIHEGLRGIVLPLEQHQRMASGSTTQLMIAHLSMGDPTWLGWVLSLPCPLAVSYHNMTPPEYFAPWDPHLAELLSFGRATMGSLAERTTLALADSRFNADELEGLGFRNIQVAGLIIDAGSLTRVPPDAAILKASLLRSGPTVLHVGQLFPHKRIDFLIAMFKIFLDRYRGNSTLVLAGATRLAPYRAAVGRLITELDLVDNVIVTGGISAAELSAHYRTADVLVTASEHEGFCVPLIEAMTFGLPIVARGHAAVPETAGDAAVLLDGEVSPSGMASALDALLAAPAAADALRRRGHVQAARFSLDHQRRTLLEAITSVVTV